MASFVVNLFPNILLNLEITDFILSLFFGMIVIFPIKIQVYIQYVNILLISSVFVKLFMANLIKFNYEYLG